MMSPVLVKARLYEKARRIHGVGSSKARSSARVAPWQADLATSEAVKAQARR